MSTTRNLFPEDNLRRALGIAVPVTHLGASGLLSLASGGSQGVGLCFKVGTVAISAVGTAALSVARTAASASSNSLDFVYRNVLGAPLDSTPQQITPTFDINSASSPTRVTTSTGHACRLLKRSSPASRNSSRAQAQIMRVHQGMRTGLSQCCLPQSADGDDDFSSSQSSLSMAAAADWRAQQWNAQLGLQSSMM